MSDPAPLTPAQAQALVAEARAVRARAYAPYSGFQVGAALLDDAGHVHLGVNVENSAYPTCQCAERTALGAAVTAGAQRFRAIAVVTPVGQGGEPGSPCGGCRQALAEFGLGLVVLLAGPEGAVVTTDLAALLPRAFTKESLR